MTRTRAADRLDDSFPHGTPAGFREGCRGNGGCPNRGTERMTCVEASQRYARDQAYRRAYNTGDIWLDRAVPLNLAVERAHASAARRATPHRGHLADPKPASAPPPPEPAPSTDAVTAAPDTPDIDPAPDTPAAPEQRWRHGTVSGYDIHGCHCPACSAAKRRKNEAARDRTRARLHLADDAAAKLEAQAARIEILEQHLTRAEQLAAHASRDRAAAIAELARTRLAFDELTELNRRLSPGRRPTVRVRPVDGDLLITISALVPADTVGALGDLLDLGR